MNAIAPHRRVDLKSHDDISHIKKRIREKNWPFVTFEVIRDGQTVERYGMITRVTPLLIWISCFVYPKSEIRNMVEVD